MTANTRLRWLNYFTMNAWFLGLGFMWNSLHRFILPAILPLLVGVGLQASAFSALTTVGLLLALIVQPIAGAISDRSLSRFGRRRPMMVQWSLVCALLLSALAFAPNFPILFVVYCLLQIASNMAHGPAQGLIPDLVPPAHHGAASGVKTFLDNATLVMAGLLTGTVLLSISSDLYHSARVAIFAIILLLLFFLGVTVFTTRETPLRREELPQESLRQAVVHSLSVIGNAADLWREDRAYAWLVLVRLLFLAGVNLVANYGQFYFKDIVLAGDPHAAQRAPQLMGQLLIIVALMLILVSVPAGVLSDRWGRRVVSAVGASIALGGSLYLLFIRNLTLFRVGDLAITDLTVTGTLIGMGVGIFFAVNWAWATDLISHQQAARQLGISNLATAGAGVLAAIGGPLIDWGNAQTFGLGYNIIFVIAAAWVLSALLLLPRIRETRGLQAGAQTLAVE